MYYEDGAGQIFDEDCYHVLVSYSLLSISTESRLTSLLSQYLQQQFGYKATGTPSAEHDTPEANKEAPNSDAQPPPAAESK